MQKHQRLEVERKRFRARTIESVSEDRALTKKSGLGNCLDRIIYTMGRNLFEFLVAVCGGVAELHLDLHQAVVLADTVGTAE